MHHANPQRINNAIRRQEFAVGCACSIRKKLRTDNGVAEQRAQSEHRTGVSITVVATLARAWTDPPTGDSSCRETRHLIRGRSLIDRQAAECVPMDFSVAHGDQIEEDELRY